MFSVKNCYNYPKKSANLRHFYPSSYLSCVGGKEGFQGAVNYEIVIEGYIIGEAFVLFWNKLMIFYGQMMILNK